MRSICFAHIIDKINNFSCWVKRNRKFIPRNEVDKINMGCGFVVADQWINIDASPNFLFSNFPVPLLEILYSVSGSRQWYSKNEYREIMGGHTFVHHDVKYGIPFPDESVSYVYSSHLLEHLYKNDAKKLLKEAFRVLRKGGIVRICVPDLEHAISLYENGNKEEALDYFFDPSESRYLGIHRYMYDFDSLKELLEYAGFTSIERCSYQEGATPDLEVLDCRPSETLYVEARK